MRILFVCSGNIMRSVIAESVFLARAAEYLGDRASALQAESGGLEAVEDSAPHPDCLHALELLGVPDCSSNASRLSEEIVRHSDLVLTMTRQQCYQMAHRFPEHSSRFFSLIEVNGAIETLIENRVITLEDSEWKEVAGAFSEAELSEALERAASDLRDAPRELMRPIPGVPLEVRELMTLFSPCFYQVSGINDPIGGTAEETEKCARQIDSEVTLFLSGMLALALSNIQSD
jgi:protein-tyrosine-phosphatase